jgi:hypothetical protein
MFMKILREWFVVGKVSITANRHADPHAKRAPDIEAGAKPGVSSRERIIPTSSCRKNAPGASCC